MKKALKWIGIGFVALFVLGVIGSMGDSKDSSTSTTQTVSEAPTTTETQSAAEVEKADSNPQVAPVAAEAEAVAPKETSNATVSQKNAVRKAQSYLSLQGFSRSGLIKQLEFEQFSTEDATYAVDNIVVDWNEQAAKKAKSYQDLQGFSRGGLITQLEFEGFTTAQANYGADAVGL